VSLKPFVKWAGGKRGLLPELLARVPETFNNYWEPFVGGGALFFELKQRGLLEGKQVNLLDSNAELINAYQVVQSAPEALIAQLQQFQAQHSETFFYQVRAWDRESDFANRSSVERAARFIYLNKTCFNGLYRVNQSGFFNVPMGRYKRPNICDAELLLKVSEVLQGVGLKVADYSAVLNGAEAGDFVYFDPPYDPVSKTANFTAYGAASFLADEQRALADVFRQLSELGCFVLLSNSDTPFICELYAQYRVERVLMRRVINSLARGRGEVFEVLIFSL